jgi:hypothetical protein
MFQWDQYGNAARNQALRKRIMTATLELPAEMIRQIAETAARRGQSPEMYLRSLLEKEAESEGSATKMLDQGVQWLTSRTAEEIQAARQRILDAAPPPRELPVGVTLLGVVEGTWPGNEIDAEIRTALERNS